MSTALARRALRAPGRLIVGPTSLSAAEPYGGTYLGLTRDAELRIGFSHRLITAEEWGGKPVEAVYAGETALFAAVLRELDNDAVAKLFPNTAAGSSSGDRIVKYDPAKTSGTVRAGALLGAGAVKLLFAPRAPAEHPAVIVYNAIPLVDEQALMQMSLSEEVGVAVLFQGTPDSSGRVYAVGKIEDLSL